MSDFETIEMGPAGRLTAEYINDRCRRLIDVRSFCCQNLNDMESLLKFLRQRKIPHACSLNVRSNEYEALAILPHAPPLRPIKIHTSDKSMCRAYALVGVKLAELAEI